jgi:hypothetical protein
MNDISRSGIQFVRILAPACSSDMGLWGHKSCVGGVLEVHCFLGNDPDQLFLPAAWGGTGAVLHLAQLPSSPTLQAGSLQYLIQ